MLLVALTSNCKVTATSYIYCNLNMYGVESSFELNFALHHLEQILRWPHSSDCFLDRDNFKAFRHMFPNLIYIYIYIFSWIKAICVIPNSVPAPRCKELFSQVQLENWGIRVISPHTLSAATSMPSRRSITKGKPFLTPRRGTNWSICARSGIVVLALPASFA